jgi:hypothetical protein
MGRWDNPTKWDNPGRNWDTHRGQFSFPQHIPPALKKALQATNAKHLRGARCEEALSKRRE